MAKPRIVLCTTTFYKNDEDGNLRKDLATRFTRSAVESDYRVFVVDGGIDDGRFIEDLKILGAEAYPETQRGLGNSRREALRYAQDWAKAERVPYIGWKEPEKVDLVRSVESILNYMDEGGASLVVPARMSLESYPVAQQHSESFGNQLHTDAGFVDVCGNSLDTFFGPKIWRREMTPFFQIFGDELNKVAQQLAYMRMESSKIKYGTSNDLISEHEIVVADPTRTDHMMHKPTALMALEAKDRGLKVASLEIDYTHPAEQTEFEQCMQTNYNGKRLMQLNALAEQFALVRRIHSQHMLDDKIDEMLKAESA